MKTIIKFLLMVSLFVFLHYSPIWAQAIIADHTDIPTFDQIPSTVIEQIKNNYNLFYGHTSHGSQLVTGMSMLRNEDILYDYNNGAGTLTMLEYGSDLGDGSGTPPAWYTITKNHLDLPGNETNLVLWSWCGGASYATPEYIENYLSYMSLLETEYPGIVFVYMTGHLDGTGPTGTLYTNNNRIRDYCGMNGKVLFDFADIESYDPLGNYFPDETDACNWCYNWCVAYPCDMCPADCAHSHCFNCYQKGKAFWCMMAGIYGWTPGSDICGDANADSAVDILDIVYMINYKYKGGPGPTDPDLWDVNSDGDIDILDIVLLINYKYKGGSPPDCPE